MRYNLKILMKSNTNNVSVGDIEIESITDFIDAFFSVDVHTFTNVAGIIAVMTKEVSIVEFKLNDKQ